MLVRGGQGAIIFKNYGIEGCGVVKKEYLKLFGSMFLKTVLVFAVFFILRCLLTEIIYLKSTRPLLISSVLIVLGGCFSLSQKKYYTSVFCMLSLFCSVLYIKVLSSEALTLASYNELVSFAVGIINAVLVFFMLAGTSMLSKLTKWLLVIVIFLPVMFLWGYYLSSGAWVSVDTVMAVLQTNVSESQEYMSDFMTTSDWMGMSVLLVAILFCGYISINLRQKNILRCGSIFLVMFIMMSGYFAYRHRHNIMVDIALQTKVYTEKYKDFENKKVARKEALKNSLLSIENDSTGIYVLVIGESQNRDNMSAYGYQRKTTPWLESIKSDNNFILFENVYSCHTHTVPVLTYALTAKNQYNNLDLAQSISLLEVAEAAGFETVWISNQVKYSAWDTPITVIADEANQQFWHNKNVGEKTATNHYDLKLVESIEKIKMSDKMLIVFHLMGNHGSYRERYPNDFRLFKGSKTLDEYDNSIFYNDFVMKNLFDRVKALPNFKGLVYFADHADAVKQNLGHDASKYVPEMTHVPMYMYFSDAYISEFDKKFDSIINAKESIVTNDLIFNIILSVMDVRVDGVYEEYNDIFSDKYDATAQRFRTLYGKKKIVSERM